MISPNITLSGTVAAPRVVDGDATMTRGPGTVFALVGNGGYAPRTITPKTALYAATSGTNTAGGITFGFAKVVLPRTACGTRSGAPPEAPSPTGSPSPPPAEAEPARRRPERPG